MKRQNVSDVNNHIPAFGSFYYWRVPIRCSAPAGR